MLMTTMIYQKRDYCQQCGSEKHVQLTHYEVSEPQMQKTCSVNEYRSLHYGCQNIGVDAVWCSGCGLMYHPNSI